MCGQRWPSTHRQQSRSAFSMASPARMIDTPQTLPVNLRPSYDAPVDDPASPTGRRRGETSGVRNAHGLAYYVPVGVSTVRASDGRWFSPARSRPQRWAGQCPLPLVCSSDFGPRPPAFLDEEADEAVSVEDKVGALGVAVADDRHQPAQLARARQHMELRVRRGEVRLSRRAPDTTRLYREREGDARVQLSISRAAPPRSPCCSCSARFSGRSFSGSFPGRFPRRSWAPRDLSRASHVASFSRAPPQI